MKQLISYSLLNSSDVTGSRYIHVGTTCQLIFRFEVVASSAIEISREQKIGQESRRKIRYWRYNNKEFLGFSNCWS